MTKAKCMLNINLFFIIYDFNNFNRKQMQTYHFISSHQTHGADIGCYFRKQVIKRSSTII